MRRGGARLRGGEQTRTMRSRLSSRGAADLDRLLDRSIAGAFDAKQMLAGIELEGAPGRRLGAHGSVDEHARSGSVVRRLFARDDDDGRHLAPNFDLPPPAVFSGEPADGWGARR